MEYWLSRGYTEEWVNPTIKKTARDIWESDDIQGKLKEIETIYENKENN